MVLPGFLYREPPEQPAAKRARTVDKPNAAYLPKGIAPFSNLIGWEVRNIFILFTIVVVRCASSGSIPRIFYCVDDRTGAARVVTGSSWQTSHAGGMEAALIRRDLCRARDISNSLDLNLPLIPIR